MDNLSKDAAMAMQLGYGVHYGAYKVDYPNTKDVTPEQILDERKFGICRYCGKVFSRRVPCGSRKIFCDTMCRLQYHDRVKNEKLAQQRKNRCLAGQNKEE